MAEQIVSSTHLPTKYKVLVVKVMYYLSISSLKGGQTEGAGIISIFFRWIDQNSDNNQGTVRLNAKYVTLSKSPHLLGPQFLSL